MKLGAAQGEEKDRYLDAFTREMDIYIAKLGIDKIVARSVLVGGGTPTYLTLQQQRRLFDLMDERIDMSTCRQYTFDVDPNTIIGPEGRERLRMMRDYGVDRLTIGVQSLDDDILSSDEPSPRYGPGDRVHRRDPQGRHDRRYRVLSSVFPVRPSTAGPT